MNNLPWTSPRVGHRDLAIAMREETAQACAPVMAANKPVMYLLSFALGVSPGSIVNKPIMYM